MRGRRTPTTSGVAVSLEICTVGVRRRPMAAASSAAVAAVCSVAGLERRMTRRVRFIRRRSMAAPATRPALQSTSRMNGQLTLTLPPSSRRTDDRGGLHRRARLESGARDRGRPRERGWSLGPRRQHAQLHRRHPHEREQELGRRTPPQRGARRRREPGQPPDRDPHERRDDCALQRRTGEDCEHHRAFLLSAFSRATSSSSSRSSASDTSDDSDRYARNGASDPPRLRSTKRPTARLRRSAELVRAR